MIMALPRRFLSFTPDQRLTDAINRHDRAVKGAKKATAETIRITNAAQRAAAEALELLEHHWMLDADGKRLPPPLV